MFSKSKEERPCSGLGSRCLKISEKFEQPADMPILPRFNNKVNIMGISFHSFSKRPLCSYDMPFYVSGLLIWVYGVYLVAWQTEIFVMLVLPNNFIKLKCQNEVCQVVASDVGAACGCLSCVFCFPIWILFTCAIV